MCGTRGTVLIVDDDASVSRTFARMLRLEGYDVSTALDAETGLREVATNHPEAVLLDLRMPFQDGLAFLRRLRQQEHDRHTPVAIITGDYIVDGNLLQEIRGLDAVLCFKPLWLEDLVRITERLLRPITPIPS
jgi:two-component system, OmpR family, response regulator PrrA